MVGLFSPAAFMRADVIFSFFPSFLFFLFLSCFTAPDALVWGWDIYLYGRFRICVSWF